MVDAKVKRGYSPLGCAVGIELTGLHKEDLSTSLREGVKKNS